MSPERANGRRELAVRDKLEQASVGIAEVDVAPAASCTRVTLERPRHDLDPMATEVLHGFLDRPWPDEAKVAVSRANGVLSVQPRKSGSMDIQLPVAEAVVAEPLVLLVNLGTKHMAIEGVRAFPIGHGDHTVVDNDARQHATDAARARRSMPSRRRALATEVRCGPAFSNVPEGCGSER